MSMLWTSADIATALQRSDIPAFAASSVSIDTRTLAPGALFVALKGEKADGHAYVENAFARGAVAAIVEQDVPNTPQKPLIKVKNSLAALEALGRAARQRSAAKITAVCGSVGKTGTKDMLARLLAALGPCHASEKSFNNHLGVPLTMANLPRDARFAVAEVGMNHPGEIVPLAAIVRPHAAIITTIDKEHIEFFENGLDGVCDANAEIFTGMGAGSFAILNRDNAYYTRLCDHAKRRGITDIIGFGADTKAQARLVSLTLGDAYSDVKADILGENITYRLPMPGAHIAMNSLAALAAIKTLHGRVADVIPTLERLTPVEGRGTRHQLTLPGGTVTLIDEAYNANPASMQAAFSVLALATPQGKGRRIAVLGDMLELGKDAPALHAELADGLIAQKIDLVYACGPLTRHLYDALPQALQGAYAQDSQALAPVVAAALSPGDVILLKSSKGSKVSHIVQDLLRRFSNTGQKQHAV